MHAPFYYLVEMPICAFSEQVKYSLFLQCFDSFVEQTKGKMHRKWNIFSFCSSTSPFPSCHFLIFFLFLLHLLSSLHHILPSKIRLLPSLHHHLLPSHLYLLKSIKLLYFLTISNLLTILFYMFFIFSPTPFYSSPSVHYLLPSLPQSSSISTTSSFFISSS